MVAFMDVRPQTGTIGHLCFTYHKSPSSVLHITYSGEKRSPKSLIINFAPFCVCFNLPFSTQSTADFYQKKTSDNYPILAFSLIFVLLTTDLSSNID